MIDRIIEAFNKPNLQRTVVDDLILLFVLLLMIAVSTAIWLLVVNRR